MDWNLNPRLKRNEKPVIRKVARCWVTFVKIGVTDYWAANKARDYCTRMNDA